MARLFIFGSVLFVVLLAAGVFVGAYGIIQFIRWVASSRLVRFLVRFIRRVAVLALVLVVLMVILIRVSDWVVTMDAKQLRATQIRVGIFQSFFTMVAIIVGAAWAYFNFSKSRTYKRRLEPEVSGELVILNGVRHLIARLRLKNVGLSQVAIKRTGSGLRVYSYTGPARTADVREVSGTMQGNFRVFKDHEWIEPGETIEDQQLIALPENEHTMAYQLHLRIVSRGVIWNDRDTVVLD